MAHFEVPHLAADTLPFVGRGGSRAKNLERLKNFITDANLSGSFRVTGVLGIGKSTVLKTAIDDARAQTSTAIEVIGEEDSYRALSPLAVADVVERKLGVKRPVPSTSRRRVNKEPQERDAALWVSDVLRAQFTRARVLIIRMSAATVLDSISFLVDILTNGTSNGVARKLIIEQRREANVANLKPSLDRDLRVTAFFPEEITEFFSRETLDMADQQEVQALVYEACGTHPYLVAFVGTKFMELLSTQPRPVVAYKELFEELVDRLQDDWLSIIKAIVGSLPSRAVDALRNGRESADAASAELWSAGLLIREDKSFHRPSLIERFLTMSPKDDKTTSAPRPKVFIIHRDEAKQRAEIAWRAIVPASSPLDNYRTAFWEKLEGADAITIEKLYKIFTRTEGPPDYPGQIEVALKELGIRE